MAKPIPMLSLESTAVLSLIAVFFIRVPKDLEKILIDIYH